MPYVSQLLQILCLSEIQDCHQHYHCPKTFVRQNIKTLHSNSAWKWEQEGRILFGAHLCTSFAMFYNNLGNIYKQQENYIKAESYYKKSIPSFSKIGRAIPLACVIV